MDQTRFKADQEEQPENVKQQVCGIAAIAVAVRELMRRWEVAWWQRRLGVE